MTNNDAILNRLGSFRAVAEAIGVENALILADKFGGTYINVPKLDDLRNEMRDRTIREEYASARSGRTKLVRVLARKHHLTTRQIYNILGKQPIADIELPLFFAQPK
jgi:Mor family transcriptional regulator